MLNSSTVSSTMARPGCRVCHRPLVLGLSIDQIFHLVS